MTISRFRKKFLMKMQESELIPLLGKLATEIEVKDIEPLPAGEVLPGVDPFDAWLVTFSGVDVEHHVKMEKVAYIGRILSSGQLGMWQQGDASHEAGDDS